MKDEHPQFDSQEQMMEDDLAKALSGIDPPEGLADRVMAASAPMLDQTLALLDEATHLETPTGLAERVMAASAPMLGPPEFQYALSRATKIEIPAGLEDRVMAASLREYASLRELQGESTVIGRVGFTVKLQRLALAACVVFAVLVAIQMEHSKPRVVTTVTNTAMQESHLLSAEEEGYLLDDLNLGDYVYLANARELNFAELSFELNGLREDIELWQYGLLTE